MAGRDNLKKGNPGNRGGGRPKELKNLCREIVEESIIELKKQALNKPQKYKLANGRWASKVVDGRTVFLTRKLYTVQEQQQAIRLLGKYAGLEEKTVEVITRDIDTEMSEAIDKAYGDEP